MLKRFLYINYHIGERGLCMENEIINARIEYIIKTECGTVIHARDAMGILYKFSACPLVWINRMVFPKIGLWVTLGLLEQRPYGFKANRAICN